MTDTTVLIPAYQPDERLPALVAALTTADPARPVVVVDDGSGPDSRAVFERTTAAGARVVRIGRNQGKGFALRVGIRTIMADHPGAQIVTADSDGQHTPEDIERVARHGLTSPEAIVLGVRRFDAAAPARSRFGNRVTAWVFRRITGTDIVDTQTGLRALPAAALPWLLTVSGDRFDYEFRVLLQARSAGFDLRSEPIRTVYHDRNAGSHFRPIVDSLTIWAPLGRFALSGLLAFGVDTIALLLLHAATGGLLFSVVGARLISAAVNFSVNRGFVFRGARHVPLARAALRYASLALVLLAANFGTLTALTDAGIALLPAKLLTEAGLFIVSFAVQRAVVFADLPVRAERESRGDLLTVAHARE